MTTVMASQALGAGWAIGGGLALWLAAASVFIAPHLYDAGARFRYRLFRPSGQGEDRFVRFDRRIRLVLAVLFVAGGGLLFLTAT